MTYDPDEFAIGMNMLWNGESVYQNTLSGKSKAQPKGSLRTVYPNAYVMNFSSRFLFKLLHAENSACYILNLYNCIYYM